MIALLLWLLGPAGGLLPGRGEAASGDATAQTISSDGLSLADAATPSLGACNRSRLTLSYERAAPCWLLQDRAADSEPRERTDQTSQPREGPNPWITALIAGLTVGGSAANSFTDGPHKPYHFTEEGWFGEDTYATPAIVDGRIYLRTAGHLYCFGL